jgi:hypothetical protein
MTPDEPSTNELTHDRTFSDDNRPMWTAPRITRFEVARTLNGSGALSDNHANAASSF